MSILSAASGPAETFALMCARWFVVFGGIALIAGGMLFGDIFAVFVLHQNGGQTGQALLAACEAASRGNSMAVTEIFQRIGGLLEDHGTREEAPLPLAEAAFLPCRLCLYA